LVAAGQKKDGKNQHHHRVCIPSHKHLLKK
jgi:hypothetical protein